ncbi:MAG: hypothetical protein FK734_20545, partial [Asgard group archaeon]|nr:hypothetical protein [Asgard group archaeon]
MIDKLQKILDKSVFKNSDFADIRLEKGHGTLITIQNGRPEQINYETEIGVGIRALIDGGWGFVSLVGSNIEEIEKSLQKAIKIAAVTSKRIKEKGVMLEDYVVEGKYEAQFKIDPRDISIEEKYKVVEELEKITREHSEQIVSTNASIRQWFQKETIINTLGTKVESEYGNLNIACMATSRECDVMQNVYPAQGTTSGWEEIPKINIPDEGPTLAQSAAALLQAETPPSGK